MSSPHHPHDHLFKKAFSDPEVASDFIRNFLPGELVRRLDLSRLQLDPSSYVSPQLKSYFSDIVYTCPYVHEKQVTLSLLFEHKTKPPAYPHLQLLRYMLEVWEQQLRASNPLSPVIPIVVYHGRDKWNMRSFDAYFEGIDIHTRPYIPDFEYLLTDLRNWKDEGILQLRAGLLRNILLLFKHMGDPAYIRQNLVNVFWQTEHLIEDHSARNLIYAMLVYIAETTDLEREEFMILLEEVPTSIKEETMTLYENILEKGIEQGIEQGIEKGIEKGIEQGIEQGIEKKTESLIRNAVAKGLDEQLIAEITELPLADVKRLIDKLQLR